MASVDELAGLRRTRRYYIDILINLLEQLEECEESSHQRESDLIVIEKQLKEISMGFEVIQHEILELDEEEHTHCLDIAEQYDDLVMRINRYLISVQQASTSIPTKCESGTGSGPMSTPPYNQTPPSSPRSGRKFTPSPTSNTQEQRKQWQRKPTILKEIDSPVTSSLVPECRELLLTAQMNILNHEAHPIQCRAVLDTGSAVNFITEKLAKSLGIKQRRCSISIGALGNLQTTVKRYITATITSMEGTYKRTLMFLVLPTIGVLGPDRSVDRSLFHIPRYLQLADPTFHKPGPIDILLSAGVTLGSLCCGQIVNQLNDTDLCLQKTRFGWVIGGSLTVPSTSRN